MGATAVTPIRAVTGKLRSLLRPAVWRGPLVQVGPRRARFLWKRRGGSGISLHERCPLRHRLGRKLRGLAPKNEVRPPTCSR